ARRALLGGGGSVLQRRGLGRGRVRGKPLRRPEGRWARRACGGDLGCLFGGDRPADAPLLAVPPQRDLPPCGDGGAVRGGISARRALLGGGGSVLQRRGLGRGRVRGKPLRRPEGRWARRACGGDLGCLFGGDRPADAPLLAVPPQRDLPPCGDGGAVRGGIPA